ncbi:MAG: hypothetical protein IJV16_08025 [Lachnospiraceae bacterium]|nr:hypothetical protein [Lachnospiraceae bacterium]
MDKPIMLTPHDIWNIFLAVCGGIVAVSAAFAVVLKMINHFKAPDKKQNERISKLEDDVKRINDRLEDGNRHFETHDLQMKELEASMKKQNRLVIESLKILIEHDIDGNNIDGLKQMNHKIDKFLLEK